MTLEELRAVQAKRFAKMQAILDGADEVKGLSEDESQRYDVLEKEFDKDKAQIERLERANERNSYMNEETSTPAHQRNDSSDESNNDAFKYRSAFISFVSGRATPIQMNLLSERAVQITGNGTEGGYLVPPEFKDEILDSLDEETSIRSLATVMRTTTESSIPVGAATPEFGWIDELGDYPEHDLTFGQFKIEAHKTGGIVLVSRELLNDSPHRVEQYVKNKMVKGLSKTEAIAFTNGNGTKKPNGVVNMCEAGLTTASSTGFTVTELTKLKYSVSRSYRKNAKWLISDDFAEKVEGLVDGNGNKIWQPSLKEGTPDRLLGFPVEYEDNLGNVASGEVPALFGDFSYYNIGDRGDIYIQVLREAYAKKGAVGILVDKRTDGKLSDKKAIKKLVMKTA